jgi:DNA adenine methylase
VELVGPFIKWAGGKRRLVHMLAKFCPENMERYFEPFLGSGALFFHLAQTRPYFEAVLSDSNAELINVYLQVRDRTAELVEALLEHQEKYYAGREKYYYHIRDSLEPSGGIERAARTLFLNKTCYNGLFRVNRAGRFNVPHGTYERPTICNRDALHAAAEILQCKGVKIMLAGYAESTKKCKAGDVVYFDPPYLPLTKTANFVDYTRESFGWLDHVALAQEFERLHGLGCALVLSNSETRRIRELYGGFAIKAARVERLINCDASSRTGQRELVITNSKIKHRAKIEVKSINF